MDRLTLRIENRSDAAGDMPEDISVLGQGISIGRKMENDWSLPDSTRFISGKHVRILYEGQGYVIEDVSTNGTFMNGSTTRIEGKRKLEHDDRIRIGSYIVAVELEPVDDSAMRQISGAQGVQAPPTAGNMRPPSGGIQRNVSMPPQGQTQSRGAQTPDFSRFQGGAGGATGVQRPTGGISMPPTANSAPPATPIPDDFDDDLLGLPGSEPAEAKAPDPAPAAPPAAATPEPAPAPAAAPDPTPAPAQPNETPAFEVTPVPTSGPAPIPKHEAPAPAQAQTPAQELTGPFSPTDPTAAPLVLPETAEVPPVPVVERTDLTPRGLGERFAETAAPRPAPAPAAAEPAQSAPAPAPAPEPTPAPEPATNALLEGFLEGAGIQDADQLGFDLHDLGVMLGKCARLGTQEMMQMLQDRSAVKFFVANDDRTMRIASGNNPMKFMIDPDEAFTALFVQPRDGYQTGPEGFDNALTDIRQHQAAMMAAIQPALADMLEGLAPKEIAQDAGGGRLGSGARKSWEEYEKRWEARAAQGENGMLDAFLDAFARRYNQALDAL
ncbi:type VI secretion system-associated FHA domain protein TagH [uncultured Tateyamaria sp.]|uniref:type VI secretion system-associated FHA domain protein TagH n=1 Tax=uncultured Tateyamaria sp. TaxID=455651 RepID=UPI0026133661|nr:type VI secretion system-associated FHA domain protein TagH [uncultured Tateyamaria sp.]